MGNRAGVARPLVVIAGALLALGCGGESEPSDAGGMDAGADAAAPLDGGGGVPCGVGRCEVGEVCCVDCDGVSSCGAACPGVACIDAGEDAGASDAGADAGPNDAGSGDAGPGDAGAISDGGSLDGGTSTCPPGECRLSPTGACELPTGPVGNGCCMCTGDLCTAFCVCLAPETPIATPSGDVPVSELEVGDLVYSVDGAQTVAVPILRTRRSPVSDHVVMRVGLANGQTIEVSPLHPTADGRRFGALLPGGELDGVGILDAVLVPYDGALTYDILPASDTGTYFAGGALIGSTLFREE